MFGQQDIPGARLTQLRWATQPQGCLWEGTGPRIGEGRGLSQATDRAIRGFWNAPLRESRVSASVSTKSFIWNRSRTSWE